MSWTLTHVPTADTLAVVSVLGHQSRRPVDTAVHVIIGRPARDFTLKPAGPREGTFRLFTAEEAAALVLEAFLCRPGSFSLIDTTTAIADTVFTPTGGVSVELDPTTMLAVVVSVDYTEVLA